MKPPSVAHEVAIHPLARADLFDLYGYIEEHPGAERAGGYVDRIEALCGSLAALLIVAPIEAISALAFAPSRSNAACSSFTGQPQIKLKCSASFVGAAVSVPKDMSS